MHYLIDIGSSTVKVYERINCKVSLILSKTFDFKDGFDSTSGLTDANKKRLFDFFDELITKFSLTRSNTKLFATGIFREIIDKQFFVEEFYARTRLLFNILSHDLEAFYLEKAWVGGYKGKDKLLIINIGGKTTELIFYENDTIVERKMLSIGVGTILSKYPSINEEYSSVSLNEIVDFVISELPLTDKNLCTAIYTGGELTYMQIAGYELSENTLFTDEKHPAIITLNNYCSNNQRVFSEISITDLRSMMPKNPKWMNGARACSAIAQAIFIKYGIETIIPSDSNLIDGINVQEARNVVICGSFNKYLGTISELINRLKDRGFDILSPKNTEVVGSEGDFILFKDDIVVNHCTWSVETQHLQAIERCDFVIICNFEGYVGTKTALEIGYAYKCGKKIVFLEDNSIVKDFDIPSEIKLL